LPEWPEAVPTLVELVSNDPKLKGLNKNSKKVCCQWRH